MLPFKNIYVDSRWCTSDSVDAFNFKVELPQTMLCPENTVFKTKMIVVFLTLGIQSRPGIMTNYMLQY
jgi:hypothetical protein